MFETYRLLGAEREAELLAEADRLHKLPSSRWRARLARVRSSARRLTIHRQREADHVEPAAEGEATIVDSVP